MLPFTHCALFTLDKQKKLLTLNTHMIEMHAHNTNVSTLPSLMSKFHQGNRHCTYGQQDMITFHFNLMPYIVDTYYLTP